MDRCLFATFVTLTLYTGAFGAQVATSGTYGEDFGGAPGDELSVVHGSEPGVRIVSLFWDLRGSAFDLVFDPEQPSGGQPGEVQDVVGHSGFTGELVWGEGFFQPLPEARTVYRTLTLEFGQFDACEEIRVLVDVDRDGGVEAFVDPAEFAGATLTVTYSDGSSTHLAVGTYLDSGLTATVQISEDAPGLSAVPPLLLYVERDRLHWCADDQAERFDVIRGSLSTLRSSPGDYAVATEECLVDNSIDSSLSYVTNPGPDDGFWFLAREVVNQVNETYDSLGSGQVGSRDAGIAASGFGCP